MKVLVLTSRVLLGLMFVVFGANGLHPFMGANQMPPTGTPMGDWVHVMHDSGWTTVVALCQMLGGLFVLAGVTVPLGLCLLCPITFNILVFHVVFKALAPQMIILPVLVTLMELLLLYAYRHSFARVWSFREKPEL